MCFLKLDNENDAYFGDGGEIIHSSSVLGPINKFQCAINDNPYAPREVINYVPVNVVWLSPLEVDKMKCPLIMSLLAGCLPAEPSDIKPPRWNDFCTDKSPPKKRYSFCRKDTGGMVGIQQRGGGQTADHPPHRPINHSQM